MDAETFIKKFPDDVAAVCKKAGTKPVYLRQIAHHFRKPSPALARKLEAASRGRMDTMSLLFPPPRRKPVRNRLTTRSDCSV